MHAARSLRIRLFVLILGPLMLIASVLGVWRYQAAQTTADDIFDRALLSAALAVSRDIVISGGDALSPTTRDILAKASGGEVFYHFTGPAGIYVAGYSYPPITSELIASNTPRYSQALYRDKPVHVLQLTEEVSFDGLSGDATVTVWQFQSERQVLTTALALRAAALISVLLLTLAMVVWFGVQRGLRPLTRLEDAISSRSPDDLGMIKRAVPAEARGTVATLNRLFSQLRESIDAQQVFISHAAHQLRNPAAAVQSLAVAVRDAPEGAERERRIQDLVSASRDAARVAEQLLSLERIRQTASLKLSPGVDLNTVCLTACEIAGVAVLAKDIRFDVSLHDGPLSINADTVLLAEAIKNLIDNALIHGGSELSYISIVTACHINAAEVRVVDDGVGLSPDDLAAATGRFTQVVPGQGSGLGLSIAQSVAERHAGKCVIHRVEHGASLSIFVPLAV